MQALLAACRGIDAVTAFIGRHVKWLVLAAIIISAVNAIVRKAFDSSSNAWLELQWYLFGAVFMLAAAYTLQRNAHIRIDVVSAHLRKRTRDWIDLFCHIVFLLPFVLMMIWLCWPFFLDSYRSQEMSMNSGGLIIWPAKLIILIGFVLLFAQAISEIIKRIAILAGILADHDEHHAAPAVLEPQLSAAGRDPAGPDADKRDGQGGAQ
ncbi:TRAP transporter small permease subunit [Dongia sp.]|uniref:TRAP transporter small permease subunit n=1 Tax=Dongia sp. TaxID=1977262 RepID=UPI0035B1726D